eukprot:CAMPEP_0116918840 /NCGR_PEP_ID=MMETSP0467-20121206/20006_1 /TAXON_ID=283647 /ORGANISM="Mesodinium pulex, Strain SPMC105" /LENGTH=62 /DNA_ID=CAMNT_0004596257 /DNA_START=442 /DNA_END=630 /DNA_ORIENTATION=+
MEIQKNERQHAKDDKEEATKNKMIDSMSKTPTSTTVAKSGNKDKNKDDKSDKAQDKTTTTNA